MKYKPLIEIELRGNRLYAISSYLGNKTELDVTSVWHFCREVMEFTKEPLLELNDEVETAQQSDYFEQIDLCLKAENPREQINRYINSLLLCHKKVENGKAICGVKLDCHLHDWRQK